MLFRSLEQPLHYPDLDLDHISSGWLDPDIHHQRLLIGDSEAQLPADGKVGADLKEEHASTATARRVFGRNERVGSRAIAKVSWRGSRAQTDKQPKRRQPSTTMAADGRN